jgi:hypothetical protein
MVGGMMRFASSKTTYTTAVEELTSVLQRVDGQTCLGKKKGSVRLLGMLGVLAGRESGKRGFRTTSFYSSSPQIQN